MIMLGGQQGWFGEAPVGLATPPDSLYSSRFRFHSLPGMTAVEAQSVGDFRNVSSAVCVEVTVKVVDQVSKPTLTVLHAACKDAAALAGPRHESCWAMATARQADEEIPYLSAARRRTSVERRVSIGHWRAAKGGS
jgi:hypothetical protein